MSETVSFVARDSLADWLESQADEEMKTVSSFVQDIVAAEYRRQTGSEADKSGLTESPPEPLDESTRFDFPNKKAADAARTEFDAYVAAEDDARMGYVIFEEGTPATVVKELERRSQS